MQSCIFIAHSHCGLLFQCNVGRKTCCTSKATFDGSQQMSQNLWQRLQHNTCITTSEESMTWIKEENVSILIHLPCEMTQKCYIRTEIQHFSNLIQLIPDSFRLPFGEQSFWSCVPAIMSYLKHSINNIAWAKPMCCWHACMHALAIFHKQVRFL